jgi:NAD(P)H-dependent FMN reductase
MAIPKILVLASSTRTGSYNVKLAALAAKELTLIDAEVTRISLVDYELPLYDPDLDARVGQPANALRLKQMIGAHHGVFIASAEYSASITPILKNAIDWVSRVRERGDPMYAAFRGRVFAIASASQEALADGAAPGSRAWLRRAGAAGAGGDRAGRPGVRRHGQPCRHALHQPPARRARAPGGNGAVDDVRSGTA